MIKAILVFNNHGRPRLSKFYQYFVSKLCRKNAYVEQVFIDFITCISLTERRYAAANN